MLKPIHEVYADQIEAMLIVGLGHYVALERPLSNDRGPVGAYLRRTHGRTRGAPNFILINGEHWESDAYKRSKFKAWSDAEAIEIANRRLAEWRKAKA